MSGGEYSGIAGLGLPPSQVVQVLDQFFLSFFFKKFWPCWVLAAALGLL